jgi:hypothetical protein
MKIKILNKIWELVFLSNLKDRGSCDSPYSRNKKIRIWKGLKDEEKLEVLIHEMLHAAFWQIDEHYIAEAAKDIAKILWKLGYKND